LRRGPGDQEAGEVSGLTVEAVRSDGGEMHQQVFKCGVCGNGDFEFGGLQWWPLEAVERYGWTIAATDPEHPGEGAVRLLICTQCRGSYVEAASSAGYLPQDLGEGPARGSAEQSIQCGPGHLCQGVTYETMMVNKLRILIADDQRRARQSLKALLATKFPALEIYEAENGSEAIQSLEGFKPHLALLDARMPEMDGIEATRAIKRQAPHIKVLVLSMYAEYRTDALAAGADMFMTKGEAPEHLLDALTTMSGDYPQS